MRRMSRVFLSLFVLVSLVRVFLKFQQGGITEALDTFIFQGTATALLFSFTGAFVEIEKCEKLEIENEALKAEIKELRGTPYRHDDAPQI